jgi:hypothetical protein
MDRRTFTVTAIWDDEAKVYYSESDIIGLHIEAATLEEFEAVMLDVAPSLVVRNHYSKSDLMTRPMADLIPAILWQRPTNHTASA